MRKPSSPFELYAGDCLKILPTIPADCADLVFVDPPFNINFSYEGYDDNLPRDKYLAWTSAWIAAAVRVLKPTGSMFVAIGDDYAAEVKIRLDAAGLTMRNWIVWHYTFGVACQGKFSRSHTHILYYVADPKRFTFNADAVRVASARASTYGDKRASPKGKLPDDVWALRPEHSPESFRPDSDMWRESRVCGTFKERVDHCCQMPEIVLDRIVRVATNPRDLVLDPMCGSGTTVVSAVKNGRRAVGIELNPWYLSACRDRLKKTGVVAV